MAYLQNVIKPRVQTAHKGDYGRILVVGGSKEYVGAPALTGMAALASGADLVTIAAPEKAAWAINALSPNLITRKLEGEFLVPAHVDGLVKLLPKFDCVVVGNGLGEQKETIEAVKELFKKVVNKPIIVDADAFKAKVVPKKAVLTPHQREFENSGLGKAPSDLEKRKEAVLAAAKTSKTTILLKGPVDIISDGKRLEENRTHNPEMTVGGTGDTLTGILATFLAQSGKPFESACAAAWVNGMTGDLCLKYKRRVLASWMIEYIPEAIQMGL